MGFDFINEFYCAGYDTTHLDSSISTDANYLTLLEIYGLIKHGDIQSATKKMLELYEKNKKIETDFLFMLNTLTMELEVEGNIAEAENRFNEILLCSDKKRRLWIIVEYLNYLREFQNTTDPYYIDILKIDYSGAIPSIVTIAYSLDVEESPAEIISLFNDNLNSDFCINDETGNILGYAHWMLGETDEAIKYLEKARRLDKSFHNSIALANNFLLKDLKIALKYFNEAISFNPYEIDAYLDLLAYYVNTENFEEYSLLLKDFLSTNDYSYESIFEAYLITVKLKEVRTLDMIYEYFKKGVFQELVPYFQRIDDIFLKNMSSDEAIKILDELKDIDDKNVIRITIERIWDLDYSIY